MNRAVAFTPLVALVGLAALFLLYGLRHDPRVNPAALVGRPAPRLSLPPLQGGPPTAVLDLRAGPVVINFFASWCAPCALEAPALEALKADGVRIVGVAYKDDPVETAGFLRRVGDPFSAVVMDVTGRAGIEYGVSAVPETFLVTQDGQVLAKYTGALSAADVASLARQAHVGAMRGVGG